MRLRIDLAYDGSGFHGFARQPGLPTVQGTLAGALSRVCGLVRGRSDDPAVPLVDERVVGTCAGRTDAGVHALGQVVHVDLDPSWSPAAARTVAFAVDDPAILARRLDDLVGDAITVWSVSAVEPDFDARFAATERRYRYLLTDRPAVDPRGRALRWDVGEPLDVDAMHAAVQHLLGEHDFASLCRRADGRHTIRRLDAAAVTRGPAGGVVAPVPATWAAHLHDAIHVTLRGPAFCHQQVRAITGCLVEVGRGRRDPGWLADVLAARDRSVASRVAPPGGLTLESVAYPDPWPDSPHVEPPPPAFDPD